MNEPPHAGATRAPSEAEQQNASIQARMLAGVALANMAGAVSPKLDAFASWILAGFGAAIGLLLSSHDASSLVPSAAVHTGARLFCWAVVATLLEKYLAIVVLAGAESAAAARTLIQDHLKNMSETGASEAIDIDVFAREINISLFWPLRWLGARALAKVRLGDLAYSSRMLVIFGQVQGGLVLVLVVLLIVAISQVGEAFPR